MKNVKLSLAIGAMVLGIGATGVVPAQAATEYVYVGKTSYRTIGKPLYPWWKASVLKTYRLSGQSYMDINGKNVIVASVIIVGGCNKNCYGDPTIKYEFLDDRGRLLWRIYDRFKSCYHASAHSYRSQAVRSVRVSVDIVGGSPSDRDTMHTLPVVTPIYVRIR